MDYGGGRTHKCVMHLNLPVLTTHPVLPSPTTRRPAQGGPSYLQPGLCPSNSFLTAPSMKTQHTAHLLSNSTHMTDASEVLQASPMSPARLSSGSSI